MLPLAEENLVAINVTDKNKIEWYIVQENSRDVFLGICVELRVFGNIVKTMFFF